jgi:hypothetical protein
MPIRRHITYVTEKALLNEQKLWKTMVNISNIKSVLLIDTELGT